MGIFASQLWFTFVLCWCGVYINVHATSQPSSAVPCFVSCVCNNSDRILCTANRAFTLQVNEFNKYLQNRSSKVKLQVHFRTESTSLPAFLPRLPVVYYLSLVENNLDHIQNGVLKGMRLQELNLSHNHIQEVHNEAFHDLNYLQVLDLSYNRLSSISKLVFADLPNLRVLNLDFNDLLYFPFNAFSNVPRLEVLSVNHNMLSYLLPGALLGLSSLRSLGLRNNSLWSVTVLIQDEAPSVKMVDISANPFHCSCSIAGLRSIVNSSTVVLLDPDHMRCFTPFSFREQRVVDVVMGLGECHKPLSMMSYDSQTVLYMDDIQLSCDIQGDPDPAILWLTPWGDQFADPSHLARLESVCSTCRHRRQYDNSAISMESTVTVTQGGKSLRITNFRGLFNGNVTCHAYNYLGNDSATHTVEILSGIPTTFLSSLFIGAFSAGGFLCFGLLVGSIKLIVQACRARFGKRRKVVRTPTYAILFPQEEDDNRDDSHCRDHSVDFDFHTPPSSPTSAVSPPTSPLLPHTPDEEWEGSPWHTGNLLETMDEVRGRLRHGMGRKMKTMKRNVQSIRETGRRNVQSIRESGSMYMQNIRDTGSTAASKVRAGVVMGMETVKLHVQSIKEFCGTGDMGTHTVSAISMETNLDTNETTEVVKSVTEV